jgi:hypothetical protein
MGTFHIYFGQYILWSIIMGFLIGLIAHVMLPGADQMGSSRQRSLAYWVFSRVVLSVD